jgi:hypothetical protein
MDPMTSSNMRSNVETASHLVNMEKPPLSLGRKPEKPSKGARTNNSIEAKRKGIDRIAAS